MFSLDPDFLHTFLAISETGSFGAAGERVNKTQSTVSAQMKRLEEIIGVPLFEREGRRNVLYVHVTLLPALAATASRSATATAKHSSVRAYCSRGSHPMGASSRSSSCVTIPGSWPASSIRSSRAVRRSRIRSSPASSEPPSIRRGRRAPQKLRSWPSAPDPAH